MLLVVLSVYVPVAVNWTNPVLRASVGLSGVTAIETIVAAEAVNVEVLLVTEPLLAVILVVPLAATAVAVPAFYRSNASVTRIPS